MAEHILRGINIMKYFMILACFIFAGCSTLGWVEYEGQWITKDRYKEILELQHRVFDLHIYDDDNDMSMSVKNPNK
jgi:hypothetical protein